MKLTQLHEAKLANRGTGALAREVLKRLQAIKPGAKMEDIAWFAAVQEASYTNDYSRKDMAHLFYDGLRPLKDNVEAVDGFYETWFYEENIDTQGWNGLEKEFRSFFDIS